MDYFNYQDGELVAEQVSLRRIARDFGTPCYIYSRATLERHYKAFLSAYAALDTQICYAVKANSNLAVLDVLARLGSGFDIVSGGELARVLAAGGEPGKIIFSGVGKSADEISQALEVGVGGFNIESAEELAAITHVTRERNQVANVSVRVNPDVDPQTHPYIATGLKEAKFGVSFAQARHLYREAHRCENLHIEGVDCHIGSQVTSLEPFVEALTRVLQFVAELAGDGIKLSTINLGGGLGIRYRDEAPPEPDELANVVVPLLKDSGLKLQLEPGRSIAGNAGVLLTTVRYMKVNEGKHFAIVDAAMNDLIRPALYDGWHDILPVVESTSTRAPLVDVVGPVCESADFLGKQRPLIVSANDLLAVRSAGAYGFVMSSNYNTRPRAAEVMVDGADCFVVRRREKIEDLFATESLLP